MGFFDFLFGNDSPPPAPNFMPLVHAQKNQSAVANARTQNTMAFNNRIFQQQMARAREQDAYFRDLTERQFDRQKDQDQLLNELLQEARDRQELLDEQGAEDRAYYERIFRPLEKDLSKASEKAQQRYEERYGEGDIQRRASQAAQGSVATVAQQYKVARAAAQDRLESFGIDPSQVRSGALDLGARLDQAKTAAGAFNTTYGQAKAREEAMGQQERAYADALRSEAINVGRGMAGGSMNALGAALANQSAAGNFGQQGYGNFTGAVQSAAGMGQQGFANYGNTGQAWSNAMGTPTQWAGLGQQALSGAANTMNQGYANQINLYKAMQDQSSGWGSALGLIGGLGATAMMPGLQTGFTNWLNPTRSYQEGGEVEPALPYQEAMEGEALHQGVPIRPAASPSRGKAIDDVPARLNVGEFVVPKDAVMWHGEKTFHGLIEKARKSKQEVQAKPKMAALPLEEPTVSTVPEAPSMPPPSPTTLHPTPMPVGPRGAPAALLDASFGYDAPPELAPNRVSDMIRYEQWKRGVLSPDRGPTARALPY